MPAPLLCRVLIRVASRFAPRHGRLEWRARWTGELRNWQLLVERGELVGEDGGALCRRAFADALGERFGGMDFRQIVRSPWFVPAAIVVFAALLCAFSHGFAVTRSLLAIARDIRTRPLTGFGYDWRGDRLFAYLAPTLLALATSIGLLFVGCLSLRVRGWRYWSFLALKVIAVLVLLPLVWVEGGAVLRSYIPSKGWRVGSGVLMAFAFVIGMGRAIIWTVADQRRRCPSCLRRLILPVTVGSWGSLFEPATTEMLCEDGHGALALSDAQTTGQDHWTELDDSWRTLFR
jgi:hypothetical protein